MIAMGVGGMVLPVAIRMRPNQTLMFIKKAYERDFSQFRIRRSFIIALILYVTVAAGVFTLVCYWKYRTFTADMERQREMILRHTDAVIERETQESLERMRELLEAEGYVVDEDGKIIGRVQDPPRGESNEPKNAAPSDRID